MVRPGFVPSPIPISNAWQRDETHGDRNNSADRGQNSGDRTNSGVRPNSGDRLDNGDRRPSHPDPADELYLHHSDHPSLVLSTSLLDDRNYNSWRRSVEVSLFAKNKLGFVNGLLPRPPGDSPRHIYWDRCDNMVFSWLLHSVSKDISESILYCRSFAQAWQNLESRFRRVDCTRIYQVQRDLNSLSQDNLSVTAYFTRCKRFWDEYHLLIEDKVCSCGSNAVAQAILQDQQVVQFLMGLGDAFSVIRGNILMLNPAPSIDAVYNLVLQEESQREIHIPSQSFDDESSALAAQRGRQSYSGSNNGSNRQSKFFCDHCKHPGHTMERCWKLHGYPPSHPGARSNKVAAYVSTEDDHDSSSSVSCANASSPALTQAQYDQLLSLLSKQSSTDSCAFLAGPFNEDASVTW